ncbi:MAG: 4-alpha-glucanotransferase [Gammaproteobacteria bacterium]|nr:4-alpha-glucanotransferase [Gammaproteobacteria bacterium]MDH5225852.1 4-alpha-glucanotransferase [Gammaproteobacteria bacterium]
MLDSLLDQLARQRGIGDEYENFRCERVAISPESKRAILVAMGIAVDDADAMAAALRAYDAQRWQSILPPVAVVHPGRIDVMVAVPADSLDRMLEWHIALEGGGARTGRIRAAELGEAERAEVDGRWQTCRYLWVPRDTPPGYHELTVTLDGGKATTCRLVVAPQACYEPPAILAGARLWGVATQLYTLRSRRNWGIGDFADLREVVSQCAAAGAAFVGLNPLHALFPANPWHFSPYSASSRHFLNVLYIAVDRLPELEECAAARERYLSPAFQAELARLRATADVDYAGAANAKFGVLELLFAHFQVEHLAKNSVRARHYADFKAQRGETLRLQALHDAIEEALRRRDSRYWGWPVWPDDLRDPRHAGVAAFARQHADRVEFHAWLQWLADEQLRDVQTLARSLGMPIGLYGDYAVGVNPSGAETWADQALYRKSAGLGAPPDALALKGQDWGIPPQDPSVLRAERYEPFRELLAASMRNFGALRLDHVMALYRQWWVPVGLDSTHGGYVHYPVDDLMSVLALESSRHECLVVGEDLGTVPEEMSRTMAERAVYSYKVLLFEKHADGSFKRPEEYPRRSIATVTTHDLPTLKGYWTASDIDLRRRLSLYPDDATCERVRAERIRDREALLAALAAQGLDHGAGGPAEYGGGLADAIHVYLSRTESALVVLQAEDLAGMADPVNVPGTSDEHANWQRKMSVDLADVFQEGRIRRLFAEVSAARKR